MRIFTKGEDNWNENYISVKPFSEDFLVCIGEEPGSEIMEGATIRLSRGDMITFFNLALDLVDRTDEGS